MDELVSFVTAHAGSLVFQVSTGEPGYERMGRRPDETVSEAAKSFEEALERLRGSLGPLIETLRVNEPSNIEIEFGIRMNAEVGAVVAKTGGEGHFLVRMNWSQDSADGR